MEFNIYFAMAITGFFSALGGGIGQILIEIHKPEILKLLKKEAK